MKNYYTETYEDSLKQFLTLPNRLREKWGNVKLIELDKNNEKVGMKIILCEAAESEKVIILSSGLHGIEGFVGSAMIQLFTDKFIQSINSKTTSLILIHGINAWGMKNFRKVNEDNIDLNRNFVIDWKNKDQLKNPEYSEAVNLLEMPNYTNFRFYQNFIQTVVKLKPKGLTKAVTLGQFDNRNGIYYGGTEHTNVVSYLMDYYQSLLSKYKDIIFLDLHTGYGPSNQMHLVNSKHEKRNKEFWKTKFNYPYIQCNDGDSFYHINGDMVDCIYNIHKNGGYHSNLFATTFEFGTIGETLLAQTESLKITIEDNYLAVKENQINNEKRINRMKKLYYPSSKKWREKAISDAEVAFKNILLSLD
ncbi:M14 family metallopeptidase [Bacillus sp. EAC]|uniref:M14 family metallopeptidase n=1 Tax=Bacillus sp. EAC TaxID=1978338 RepID=UPI000B44B97D|nr:M14 family metallopeptidase [Bacillus sp. EAC]